jgi:hypothetical protein
MQVLNAKIEAWIHVLPSAGSLPNNDEEQSCALQNAARSCSTCMLEVRLHIVRYSLC